jgi:thiol-disulfide isomerase/thioredoxin
MLLLIAVLAVALAGCASHQASQAGGKMGEIDAALQDGPVFVEFGAPWCDWCGEEKLVVESLSASYGSIAFIDVDVDMNRSIADDFYVEGIPQMHIIVRKNPDGSYLYIDPQGKATTDRSQSRIVGYRDADQLKRLLDVAVTAR